MKLNDSQYGECVHFTALRVSIRVYNGITYIFVLHHLYIVSYTMIRELMC